MPRYEVSLIMRLLQREETISALSGICSNLLKSGHNIRKVQSLGSRTLPYYIKHKSRGTYVILDMDVEAPKVTQLETFLQGHENLLKATIFDFDKVYQPEKECKGLVDMDYEKKLKEKDPVKKKVLRLELPGSKNFL